ncbi:chromosome segregation protein [Mariprofundus micogutta]|uniref:Chromosome partition protein Smc n=1 Tax=Mariprofundus micogutta TaxID=1921010 RepID=A0A1L8CMC0_9PROT|nr:chromosome segregation protein SMC [Mariprofundus micogutta]GAV20058.1 chromosome segregation protein [Mariprofundus micogutta]
MRLKRIELAGFKSFVDPTRIDLDRGITAIVGPNGCGKSNIIDALRWVLGEHSAKHLRGGVMDDLIFQGSDTRPPVAICDVELTFAIEKGSLATPYHELDEIRVRRRLMREGGSDAFINGKMVRLKDVVDLFLDTGISTRAYAIVEQGSIARMVTAKPEERRVIFEEAAGVMKYRSRRREAERRMKDTQQNLDRILDLLEEVRTQCRSLKQQAGRAERFKKMQDEFRHLQSLSLGLRYQSLQLKCRETEQKLAASKSAEAEASRQLSAAERVVTLARSQVVSHEEDAQSVQDRLRQAERKRADLQQQSERLAGERRLLTERKAALKSRIDDAQLHQQRISSELAQLAQRMTEQDDSELQALRLDAQHTLESAQLFYQQQGLNRDTSLAEFERLRHSGDQARVQKEKAEVALARLQERAARLAQQLEGIKDQHAAGKRTLAEAKESRKLNEQVFRQAEQELAAAQEQLDLCRRGREASASDLSGAESDVRALKGTVQELRGRTGNQDVSDDLRHELRARGAVWIDESLHVPEGLEAAVAAALRGRSADAHMPVNPDSSAWKETLKQVVDAPVALFAGAVASEPASGESLADAMGLKADHPLHDLFAPISLVDDITQGFDQSGYSVSRDGWRFEPSGWLVPPSGNRTARRLATQRKLRESEEKLEQAELRLSQVSERFKQAESELESGQKAWQQAHLAATRAEGEWHAAQSRVTQLQTEADSLQERQQRMAADLKETDEEKTHWQLQLQQAGHVDQAELQAAQQRLAERDVQVGSAEKALNQARTALAQVDQSLALFAQARDNLQRESARLEQDTLRLREQVKADSGRLQQVEVELQAASNQSQLDQQLSQAAEHVESMHSSMNEVRQKGHELQQAQHEAERAERQARQLLQQLSQQRQTDEVSEAQGATRLQDLAGEIMHRCQVSADELLISIADLQDLGEVEVIMSRATELEERLGRFGPVNLLAIEEFEQASERELFLSEQATDLEASLSTLGDTISRIDRTTRQRFREVFEQTNAIFQKTFPQLFGGGRAELRLDSDDILTAGVEVIAQPPGKRLQDVTLLSGGEKALTAVALVFSIFKIKPAPFCVLDEVDAPLDDANVGRFGEMVRELAGQVQFLSISHNKITMQQADRLIGVSMPEPGVSKIVAVDMGDVPE